MLFLYLLCSVFGCILVFFYETYDIQEITFLATIFHCACLYFFLSPLVDFSNRIEKGMSMPNDLGLKIFTLIILSFCLLSIVYSLPRVVSVFSYDDLRTVRQLHNSGELDSSEGSSNIFSYFGSFGHYYSFFAIFLFFYYMAYKGGQDKLITNLLFISSFAIVLSNLTIMGRDGVVRWILFFIFSFLFFRRRLSAPTKKRIISIGVFASIPIVVGFLMITIARFGERDNDLFYYILDYAGQPFIFFSYNFDQFFDGAFGGRMTFPILYSREQQVKGALSDYIYTSYNLNTFSTFIGSFYKDMGFYKTLFLSIGFKVIFTYLFTYSRRSKSFSNVILFLVLVQVVILGVFYFMFYSITLVKSLILIVTISVFIQIKFRVRVRR